MAVAVALLAMLLALLSLPSLLLAPLPLLPSLFLDSQLPCAASFSAVAATRFAASSRAAFPLLLLLLHDSPLLLALISLLLDSPLLIALICYLSCYFWLAMELWCVVRKNEEMSSYDTLECLK